MSRQWELQTAVYITSTVKGKENREHGDSLFCLCSSPFLHLYGVQDSMTREWCRPWWISENSPTAMPTSQSNDNPSLTLPVDSRLCQVDRVVTTHLHCGVSCFASASPSFACSSFQHLSRRVWDASVLISFVFSSLLETARLSFVSWLLVFSLLRIFFISAHIPHLMPLESSP